MLYRVTIPGQGGQRAYRSIGQTKAGIATRTGQHLSGRRSKTQAEVALHRAMKKVGAPNIFIEPGALPPNISRRLAHLYEIWRQHAERRHLSDWHLIRDTTPFEEVEAVNETLRKRQARSRFDFERCGAPAGRTTLTPGCIPYLRRKLCGSRM
jgi:hypothetical protein